MNQDTTQSKDTDRALQPFWNKQCADIASRMWMPTAVNATTQVINNTWFDVSMSKHDAAGQFPSFEFSIATQQLDTPLKTRKIRIYPTAEQRSIMRRMMGTARYVYNQTVEYLKQDGTKANWMGIKGGIINSLPEWAKEIPYQVKSVAVRDACEAVKSAKKKFKQTGKLNEVSFRSRKAPRQSLFVNMTTINDHAIFPKLLGDMKFTEQVPKEIKHDCRLVLEDNYRWYVVIPVECETAEAPRTKDKAISIDPGVRTFLTGYCEKGILEIGKDAQTRIIALCFQLDKMQRKMTKVKARRRQNIKRAWRRLKFRLECLKTELLWKSTTFLAKSFDTIVIPPFCAKDMAKKAKRRITSKTVRAMMSLAHSRFRAILDWQCRKYGSHMLLVSEEYTSKTCPSCGRLHETLGGRKVFRCPSCGYQAPRDANGAFNIMLKAMTDSSALQKQSATVSYVNRNESAMVDSPALHKQSATVGFC